MKYVLDSSVALKWVLAEADSAKAIRLRDDYEKSLHELLAPDIFGLEVANGLAAAERQRRIRPGESAILFGPSGISGGDACSVNRVFAGLRTCFAGQSSGPGYRSKPPQWK